MRDTHESKSKSKSNASDVPSLFPQRGHLDSKQNVSVQSRKGLAMSEEGHPSDAGFVGQPDKRARFTVESRAVKRDEAAVVKSKRRETTTKAKKQIPQKLPTAFQQRQVNPIYSPKRNSEREREGEDGEEGSRKQIKGADNKVAQERLKTPSCRPLSRKPAVGPSKAEVIVKGRTRSWAIQKEEAYEYAFRDLSTENGTILTLRAVLDDEFAIEYPHISLSRRGNDYLIKIEMLTRSEKIIRTDLNQKKQILRLCREKNGAGRRIKKQVGDEHGQPTRREAKKVKAPRKRPTITHEKNAANSRVSSKEPFSR
ncbi:hypothetical protein BU24DRAFT_415230 [Aaosphaeria arxii CBS 175.79]|uniref:Uncharacterized protein n=1 Tax=Aaosphaeria arxii CBS 175.79 TaxID=1450172 RepID=A0A6A5X8T8_9PLEO|nr:uncharacterized protein BU24DRAFT_415230 [Aaosphaeria arxii CBS 175.79]KAF2009309.1 hypothetical protein BU24DRAFT_415230 [Aaosphaeria arxii CBS 175.79]